MTIEMISLDRLEPSPANARKQRNKDRVRQFAASIEAHGILQNLQVTEGENGRYQVVIGGTRLAALTLLLKQKKIAGDYQVPCQVRPANDPALTEISLAENIVRENMHPADEFDAFKQLADAGQGPETIAARFGVTPTVVKQRLKLAVVSPKLIAAYRRDEMTLDQLMAFTVSDDRKQQEKVWAELPDWNRQRGDGEAIRAALTEQHVSADSKLARFVGIEAYEKAGGVVLRDLFDEANAGWLTDIALLNRLAAEKLEAAAAPLSGEGWKWVEIAPDRNRPEAQQHGQIRPAHADPNPEQQAELDTLQAEADAIMEEHGEEPADEAAHARLQQICDRIDVLSEGEAVWTDEQKAVAGIVISIGHDGEAVIERGIVKPEDKAAVRKLARGNGADHGDEADDAKPAAKPKGGLPAALIAELTAHKTTAAQLTMATNTAVSMLAVSHALALRMLYDGYSSEHTSLGITGHGPSYPLAIREAVDGSAPAKKLTSIIKGWQKKLPKEPADLWAWMEKQKPVTISNLLAVCAARSIDLMQVNGAEAKPAAAALARSLKLDMAEHWEATAENYFTRVPKKRLLEELGDNLKPNTRTQVATMKRDLAAKTIVAELKGKRWIPDVLKAG